MQQRLRDVVIENLDFEQLLRTYDRPGALFYLDPPYYKAEGFYQGFRREDHRRLFHCLKKLKGRFVLSYNDAPEVRQLYEGYTVHEARRGSPLTSRTGRTGEYRELIITNY
ncbi:DNA adenine methylase [Ruminococcaceae bacterium OttesenSCG-928-D13]|nr:DNA adenine methylase [Ruminococcaceae bacterium OttesenSCG-928-D13]